jgi:hypothetical protein
LTLYGKTAVKIQDSVGDGAHIIVNASGITLAFGTHSIVISSSGIAINGPVTTIDGKPFLTHKHTDVTPGGGNTGDVL